MADASETRLCEVLQDIAKQNGYPVQEIKLKPISTGGANYTSKLFAVNLSAPGKKDLDLFCKVATLGEKMRSMTTLSVFETEIRFYTRILPIYRELEEIHKVPEEERLILPKYYGGCTERLKEVLVIQDLSEEGFQTMNRVECFDWEYASRSISALARFHALSVALEKLDPTGYSEMVQDLKFDYPADQDYLNKGLLNAVKATDEKFRDKVNTILQDDLKKNTFVNFWEPAEQRPVLCHGDFRHSNVMHKVDKDGNLSVALVDYQVIRRGNPVADLVFFLICGSDEQFRDQHLSQFFDHYYQTFSAALRRLNIDARDVYAEKNYRDDVQKMLAWGLTLGVYCLPFITVDAEDAPKPEDCIDVENFDLKVGGRFRDRFNGLVRTYAKLGFI